MKPILVVGHFDGRFRTYSTKSFEDDIDDARRKRRERGERKVVYSLQLKEFLIRVNLDQ